MRGDPGEEKRTGNKLAKARECTIARAGSMVSCTF